MMQPPFHFTPQNLVTFAGNNGVASALVGKNRAQFLDDLNAFMQLPFNFTPQNLVTFAGNNGVASALVRMGFSLGR